jgi:hypothetical protein
MKSLKNPLMGFVFLALVLFGTGCAVNPAGTGVPWNSPASWENQVPGMGGPGGMGAMGTGH